MELKYDAQGDGTKRLMLETYGCQMNVADSEVVATVMKMAGYETCETIDEADAIFINTCSVRDNAEQKIFSRLNQLNAYRHKRQRRLIIGIIGCMAERLKEVLISEHDVDVVAGPDAYLELPALIALAERGEKAINTQLSTTETYRDIIPSRVGGSRAGREGHQHPAVHDRDLSRYHPVACGRQQGERLYQHHEGVQQLLHLLHRALYTRP